MIKRLKTRNFTVLRNADLKFSPDLNIIIGENGTGKTHVIKLLYSILSAGASQRDGNFSFARRIADKLLKVFMPERLGRLTTRTQGRTGTSVCVEFSDKSQDVEFSFATNSKSDVKVRRACAQIADRPVYFPAKELLSIYPNFTSLYGEYHLPYDETYFDTISMLGLPYAKGPRTSDFQDVIGLIEEAIEGSIRLDPNGRSFHLLMRGEEGRKGNMEIDLVAEGWRKLGMLTQVVLNNALKNQGCLFWDEPEANLNPKLIKIVAQVIFKIATESKIQVFITTHSLFLLRELEFLSVQSGKTNAVRYIGIRSDGQIDQGDSSVSLMTLSALDAEVDQSNRIVSLGVRHETAN